MRNKVAKAVMLGALAVRRPQEFFDRLNAIFFENSRVHLGEARCIHTSAIGGIVKGASFDHRT